MALPGSAPATEPLAGGFCCQANSSAPAWVNFTYVPDSCSQPAFGDGVVQRGTVLCGRSRLRPARSKRSTVRGARLDVAAKRTHVANEPTFRQSSVRGFVSSEH